MTAPVFLAGHSAGGAHVYQYAYSRIMRGLPVDGIYTLAPARPGDEAIETILARVPVIRALHNGRDIVPRVPVDLKLFNEEYVQPHVLEEIHVPPVPDDPDPLTRWHHADLYAAGARMLQPSGAEAVSLADAADQVVRLYAGAAGWDWINPVDGAYWAMMVMPSGARLAVARGTVTMHDWFDNFDAVQINVMGARMSRGFWSAVEPIQDALDRQLA